MWWCIWATGSTRKGSTNHGHWQKRNGSWFCARIFAPIRRPCMYPPTHAKSILRSSAGSDWIISLCRFVCRESNSLSATVQNGKSFNAFTKTSLVPEYVRLYILWEQFLQHVTFSLRFHWCLWLACACPLVQRTSLLRKAIKQRKQYSQLKSPLTACKWTEVTVPSQDCLTRASLSRWDFGFCSKARETSLCSSSSGLGPSEVSVYQ